MVARIVEMELNDADAMREDGPTVLCFPVNATLEDVFQASICADLRDLFQHTLNGPLTPEKRRTLTIQQTLAAPDLAPRWIGALVALDTHVSFMKDINDVMQLEHYLAHQPDQAVAVCVPLNVPGRMWCETQIAPADGSILSAMAVVDLNTNGTVRSARLSLTGLGVSPVSMHESIKPLHGQPLTEDTVNAVAAAVVHEVDALGFGNDRLANQLVEITRATFKTCRSCDCR